MTKPLGVVASGHKETSKAARLMLEQGGNAFDAVLAAMCAACVSEPMLASLGGGGFLLAQTSTDLPRVYDFFTQTPSATDRQLDFYPIQADFGTTTQEFHIGMGSIAVPGVVAGLFAIHREHCRLPLEAIMEPAIFLAREGLRINRLQKYINDILGPIINASPAARALAKPMFAPGRLAEIGEYISNPDLADTFEALVSHGREWFYQGEPAQQLVRDCERKGGLINADDLKSYEVIVRKPVTFASHNAMISVNSPPSPGGCLIAFALSLLDKLQPGQHEWGGVQHTNDLVRVMQAASLVRQQQGLASGMGAATAKTILTPEHLEGWHQTLKTNAMASRGTTHISVADAEGNLASLTLSNGEGSAYVLPGTGVMLNNMLGEEDLNPEGFHRIPPGVRLASMMTPTIVRYANGGQIALGSGGSNRIRSAILQVLTNILEFDMNLEQAVHAPRLHLEDRQLNMETGFSEAAMQLAEVEWPGVKLWQDTNLFFGGVHAVERLSNGRFRAAGDPRRGGAIAFAH